MGFWGDSNTQVRAVFNEIKNNVHKEDLKKHEISRWGVLGYLGFVILVLGLLIGAAVVFNFHIHAMEFTFSGWSNLSWQIQLSMAALTGLAALPIGFLPTKKADRKKMILVGLSVFSFIELVTMGTIFFMPPSSDFLLDAGLSLSLKGGILIGLAFFCWGFFVARLFLGSTPESNYLSVGGAGAEV